MSLGNGMVPGAVVMSFINSKGHFPSSCNQIKNLAESWILFLTLCMQGKREVPMMFFWSEEEVLSNLDFQENREVNCSIIIRAMLSTMIHSTQKPFLKSKCLSKLLHSKSYSKCRLIFNAKHKKIITLMNSHTSSP